MELSYTTFYIHTVTEIHSAFHISQVKLEISNKECFRVQL